MRYISKYEALKMYDDFLDDVYGEVSVAGFKYFTSNILNAVDPVAYHQGFLDWLDMEELIIGEEE